MALTAQQNGTISGTGGARAGADGIDAATDYPRWARRRVALGLGAALWVSLISICTVYGPSPLLWAMVAAIWVALAVACVRIQVYRKQSDRG